MRPYRSVAVATPAARPLVAVRAEQPSRVVSQVLVACIAFLLALLALLAALPLTLRAQQLAPRPGSAAPAHAPTADAPDPTLEPEAVVGIVLDALASNDGGERGLALVFAFSSPANRAVVGTLDRFVDLARDEAYRPLLGHRRAVRGAMKVDGDRATQRVIVTGPAGDRVVYTFTLSRQADSTYKGCWMTDGVTREPPSRLMAPRLT
jgi:hypothetical protein